ncbi:MAG: PHP domain-containing protein, partial [Firmicutes bacterium]|nr:PHP domain-containing protein [Bacillota bacterium]
MEKITKITANAHTHTTFCDGKCSAEEMVQAAIKYGLTSLGITLHAPIEGEFWTPRKEMEPKFIEEMARLKEKYAGTIDVYCGLEY